jgi:membrane protease YdiL (CAAX protease family)
VGIVLVFAAHESIRLSEIGLHLGGWLWNVLIGIAASFLPISLQGFYRRLYPLPDSKDKSLAAEPKANWIVSQLFSVLAEELWMALCLISFIRTGHSSVVAVILTATVFGALHFRYRFGAIGTALYGAVSASLFLWRGSLLPSYLFHYIRNLGSFYWARHALKRSSPSLNAKSAVSDV